MRATVGVPEPTWRLSSIRLRPPCGASQATHNGQRLWQPAGRPNRAFRVSTSGARQAIVRTSPLQSLARPRVAHFGARSGLPSRSFRDRSRGAVCPSP